MPSCALLPCDPMASRTAWRRAVLRSRSPQQLVAHALAPHVRVRLLHHAPGSARWTSSRLSVATAPAPRVLRRTERRGAHRHADGGRGAHPPGTCVRHVAAPRAALRHALSEPRDASSCFRLRSCIWPPIPRCRRCRVAHLAGSDNAPDHIGRRRPARERGDSARTPAERCRASARRRRRKAVHENERIAREQRCAARQRARREPISRFEHEAARASASAARALGGHDRAVPVDWAHVSSAVFVAGAADLGVGADTRWLAAAPAAQQPAARVRRLHVPGGVLPVERRARLLHRLALRVAPAARARHLAAPARRSAAGGAALPPAATRETSRRRSRC